MKNVVFVSVAFGFEYLKQMDRLQKSILRIYPEANLLFFDNGLPNGSKPFLESLYGFKPHAVAEARNQGFKKVIWLDPAMILTDKVDQLINKSTMIAIKDDSVLYNVVSDKCYAYFGLDAHYVNFQKWHLVGGSLYFFNFDRAKDNIIFDLWLNAERAGIFGSQQEASSEQLQGHRYDEAVMAMLMYLNGVEPVGPDVVRYCQESNSMFQKKHFK